MITKLQITGKLHYHRKCDFQLSKIKLGYRTLLPLTAPILSVPNATGVSNVNTVPNVPKMTNNDSSVPKTISVPTGVVYQTVYQT